MLFDGLRTIGTRGACTTKSLVTIVLVSLTLIYSVASIAEEKASIGLAVEATIAGSFFSPKLKEVTVKEVVAESPAELAGLVVGQNVLSINGCKIPGCSAKKAERLLELSPGDVLPVLVENSDGTQSQINVHVK